MARQSSLVCAVRLLTCTLCVFFCLPGPIFCQQLVGGPAGDLPDSPGAFLLQQPQPSGTPPGSDTEGTGSIEGVVLDIHADLVAGAKVTLVEEGHADRLTTSDAAGNFLFSHLPVGKYRLTITSPGLETFVSPEIQLRAGQRHEMTRIALPLASADISIQVTVTQVEIAQEQVHLEEQQRFLGVFPNFYSSYIWDAAPLNARQKFGLATHSITDPVIFVATGIAAGIEQARNTFPAYGQGTKGYAKRYGADYADEVSNRMFSSAIFPALFHQDPRYFYKGTGSKGSRAWYAITRAVITRGDDGRQEPNYSRVLGGFVAGALSNAYHQGNDRGVKLTLRNGAIAIGGHAADNLLREFLYKRFTSKVPTYATGEPEKAGDSK